MKTSSLPVLWVVLGSQVTSPLRHKEEDEEEAPEEIEEVVATGHERFRIG